MSGQVQADVAGMMQRMQPGCLANGGEVIVAALAGLFVVVGETVRFRGSVLRDGGGTQAGLTLGVSMAGVVALLYDSSVGRPGAGAVKLMLALLLAHLIIPLLVAAPHEHDDEEEFMVV